MSDRDNVLVSPYLLKRLRNLQEVIREMEERRADAAAPGLVPETPTSPPSAEIIPFRRR